jgi:hypothetical protein
MNSDPQIRLRLSVAMKLGISPNTVDEMDFEDVLGILQLCKEEAEAMNASSASRGSKSGGNGNGNGKIVTKFRGV